MGGTATQPGAPTEVPQQSAPTTSASASASASAPAPASVSTTTSTTAPGPGPGPGPGPSPSTLQTYHCAPTTAGEYSSGFPPVAQHPFPSQLAIAQTQGSPRPVATTTTTTTSLGPFNMASSPMANALPPGDYRPQQYAQGPQRFAQPAGPGPGLGPAAMAGQVHMAQYGAQGIMNAMAGQPYYMPPYYASGNATSRAGAAYYPAMAMGQQSQAPAQYYYAQAPPYQCQPQTMHAPMMQAQYMSSAPSAVGHLPGPGSPYPTDQAAAAGAGARANRQDSFQVQGARTAGRPDPAQAQPSPGPRQNLVRGPPRKPKQSGHAIWIGNLPPQTELMSLVHHVCKETKGLESLFLISKSNCAFANYKDEPTCIAAQQDLHDSRFQSVRLVSRLRKSTVEGTAGQTAPTGPATTGQKVDDKSPTDDADEPPKEVSTAVEEAVPRDKFFVLKSLTIEDLELSVRTNIWATQAHNEESLNEAFKSAENVYLIFSANKSGEYFGYARMTSPIDEDPAAAIEFAPSAQANGQVDLPKAIPTDATEFAPRGRIIDDSARGTIFWEAERPGSPVADAGSVGDTPDNDETGDGGDSGSARSSELHQETDGASKAWGKPFRLEWMSTNRLPFYRTRGLRNPWNSNREVKIARDGTELEPTVGRRLIGLFNRAQSPAAPAPIGIPGMAYGAAGIAGPMGAIPMGAASMGPTGPNGVPMVAGYPVHMRPHWSS